MSEAPSRLVAALADRYAIERELGAGGMATVYLAKDVKHGRQVAVKVLRPELLAAGGHERFLREISTTAKLRHPNILPLFDSGTAAQRDDDTEFLYYVMPFVEGESLRDRLARETQLPPVDALQIADEVADALSYAHGRGVIHRDIKPENILLENDHAVVADFGIAHAVTASGGEKLTATGMAIGTPYYMSPEQWSGEAVDGRSDLYAVGCMLYEMLAGSPPFTGPTPVAVMAGHAVHPVPPLRDACPAVTAPVAAAIERALAKSPGDRFGSIEEWRAALRSTTTPGIASRPDPTASAFSKLPPAPSTPLLGREGDLAAAIERLRAGSRVLTITGIGGTGKTRFAIELFGRLMRDYPDGAAFVSLASVTDASEVMSAIAIALDIAEAEGRSALEALATVVGDRRALLLLDNLEQVIDAAGDIAEVVARCPALQIVTTSRGPLKIGAEVELPLPPLALPDRGTTEMDELAHCPSVALFVQRAAKVKPGFALSAANAATVAEVCRRLDGLPLALELAAARVRILEPAALLKRLDRALDVLTTGDRDLPARQRTLRTTIAWSHSLLDPPEQRLLHRLSVFHEGWTFEAMEQVCYAKDERGRALDELDSLVEKGLVRVIGAGERYTLLETIRAFASEQLHAAGGSDAAHDAHADFFLAFSRGVDEGIQGSGQVEAMRRGRAETANTLAAVEWLISQAQSGDAAATEKGMMLCGQNRMFWHIVGLHLAARDALETLLPLAEDRPTRGRALALLASGLIGTVTGEWERAVEEWGRGHEDGLAIGDEAIAAEGIMGVGYSHLSVGRMEEAREALDRAITLSESGRCEFIRSLSMTIKGMLLFVTGDLEGGMAMVETARKIQERAGDFEIGGMALSFLAQMTFAKGNIDGARELYRDAEASFGAVGDKPEIARVQCERGYAALAASDLDEGRLMFQHALRTYDEVGSSRGAGQALIGLAATEAAAGNDERAVTIAAAAQVLAERAGIVVAHPMDPEVAARIEGLKASIPKARLEELVASGSALSPAAVLAMVRE